MARAREPSPDTRARAVSRLRGRRHFVGAAAAALGGAAVLGIGACIDVAGLRSGLAMSVDGGAASPQPPSPDAAAGGCSRDCLGGACEAGVCRPAVVARGESGLTLDVALTESHVFFVVFDNPSNAQGKIVRCPKEGGCAAERTELAANLRLTVASQRLAIAGADLFFTALTALGNAAIYRCPVAGCGGAAQEVTGSLDVTSRGFAVDAEFVYFGSGASVVRCARSGCDQGGRTTLAVLASTAGGMALWADDLFVTEPRYDADADTAAVWRLAKTGGSPVEAARGKWLSLAITTPRGVLVGPFPPGNVIQEPGELKLFAGDAVSTILSSNDAYAWVAADNDSVYYTTKASEMKSIGWSAPPAAVRTLLGFDPKGVAVDDRAVYFALPGGIPGDATPGVYRLAK